MDALTAVCDIRPFEKYAYLLACPPAKKAFWAEFRQTSPLRLILFFQKCVMTECIHPSCTQCRSPIRSRTGSDSII